jgi:hypothetical protein
MIGDWAGYFTAQAGAFAALTGLVFVALSINLKEILQMPGVPGRAGEAVIVLLEPVLLALLGLMGHQNAPDFGAEILGLGALGWAATSVIVVRGREALGARTGRERAVRIVGVQSATLLIVVAGALLVTGHDSGLYWQAAGSATCLVVGMTDAWVLLIEIMR